MNGGGVIYLPSLSICMYLQLIDIFYTEIGKQDMRLIIIYSSGNKNMIYANSMKIKKDMFMLNENIKNVLMCIPMYL